MPEPASLGSSTPAFSGGNQTGFHESINPEMGGSENRSFDMPDYKSSGNAGSSSTTQDSAAMMVVKFVSSALNWWASFNPPTMPPDLQGPGKVRMKWGVESVYIDNDQVQMRASMTKEQKKKVENKLRDNPEAFKPSPR